MPETRAKTATIKTIFISFFSLDTRAATPGKSWMFLALAAIFFPRFAMFSRRRSWTIRITAGGTLDQK
jgi:hypothetical protein